MIFDEADDRGMRQHILEELKAVDLAVTSRHARQFEVVRTNDRKGYRDERNFVNDSPYQDDPRTLVRIEIEVPDNVTPGFAKLVADITETEKIGKRRAKEAALEAAKETVRAALDRVAQLEKELSDGP